MPCSCSRMASACKNARGRGGGGGRGVVLEVTVLSAESLRLPPSYSLLPRRLRPYVVVSSSASAERTAAADAADPSWNDTLLVPVDAAFLDGRADVHVAVISEGCRFLGPTQLGWCRIPPADVLDGLRPPQALRRLSYSLRCPRHGPGANSSVVHLAVRMRGEGLDRLMPAAAEAQAPPPPQPGWCRVAMGIPVSTASWAGAGGSVVGMP